jgi:putative oxidoreductase
VASPRVGGPCPTDNVSSRDSETLRPIVINAAFKHAMTLTKSTYTVSLFVATAGLTSHLLAQLSLLINAIYPEGFSVGLSGIASLILRVSFGILFVRHGYPKVRHLKRWSKALGLPVFLCFIAAWTMVIGGFFLLTGFLTPLVSLGLLGTMIFALFQEMFQGHPFIAQDPYLIPPGEYEGPKGKAEPPSYEKAFIYCAVMVVILLLGPGAFSLDAILLH